MLKVMIVEDEDIVREDIKHLIDWEEHGFAITAEARNGGEGLRMFLDQNPDIIITDIKMPVMGGLEMINSILQVRKNKKFILLTAYGDFDFAREAIKLGIHSYVLKHELDGDLLLQELNKLRSRMEEEESVGYLARKEKLRMLLKRMESQPEGIEPENPGSVFRWRGRTGMFLLGFDPFDPPMSNRELPFHGKAGVDKKECIDFLYTQLFNEIEADAVDLYDNEYIIFYRIPERSSERSVFEYGSSLASHFQSVITKAFSAPVSIAVGPVLEDSRDIKTGLKKTRELFSLKIFRKGSSIMTAAVPNITDKRRLHTSIETKMKEIQEQLNRDDYEQIHSSLDELFTRLLVSLEDTAVLRSCIFELIRLINLKGMPKHGTSMIESLDAWTEIQQLDNVYQIAGWFQRMTARLEEESNSKYSKKIRELLLYIHANYQKEITLNEIADRLGFSLIYTSQLFKKEVGVSFVSYLTRYRIEKAKELLESGQYKVYEVSSMVGYQTVQYFCKTFKKITGQNPGDL